MFKSIIATTLVAMAAAETYQVKTESVGIFELRDAVQAMSAQIKGTQGKLDALAVASKYGLDAGAGTVAALNPSLRRVDEMVDQVATIAADVKNIENDASVKMASANTAVQARLATATATADKAIADANAKLGSYAGFAALADADIEDTLMKASMLAKTYGATAAGDPTIPVFRWAMFHTYSQICCWMDNDNTRVFGGMPASQWGDGNGRADQFSTDIRGLKRMFSKRGAGDKNLGAVACVEGYSMFHSTDDKRCGALFRIRSTNKKTADTTFSMSWTYTGWSGWGNQASVAVNKANAWSGSCSGYCNRNENLKLKSNSAGDRMNTVIFMAGGTSPYYNRWYYRSTMLAFNKLVLPSGFEYVDDLSSLEEGTWA